MPFLYLMYDIQSSFINDSHKELCLLKVSTMYTERFLARLEISP
jgi:hypothetical protein